MHLKRLLTAIVLIPVFVALIHKGSPLLFALIVALFSVGTLWEYYNIVFSGNRKMVFSPISLWGWLIGMLIIGAAYIGDFSMILCLLTLNLVGAAILALPKYEEGSEVLTLAAKQMQGVIYIPFLLSTLVMVRNGTDGSAWIFFILFLVFAGDSGGFYVGRYFGKHKLCPAVSPGKTVEGAVGNLAASILVGYLFMIFFLPHVNRPAALLFFILLNLFGQAGDLFASALKRAAHVKDSGGIFPGHGGFLDRIDALIFAAPVAYYFKAYIFSVA
jgi:phosphatidate cytidylyltransferase